ncbi:hypothetical protein A3K64_00845 [Candidatus Micrarchaeota archaeon RBG_16_36_9]|nr:MAG: hypothetical protein A3K64_00845 [Candidatus Micrarchaeota archaeon RBG_16_36_9]
MKINVIVIPNAKDSEVIKIDETNYKVRVDAPALDGKANKRLIEILSEYFKVQKSLISIIKGLKGKNKIIEIDM